MMNAERLLRGLDALGVAHDGETLERFRIFHDALDEFNARMDLTAVLDEDERIDRHDLDSLAPLPPGLLPPGARVADVGTGAGFPGVPLLIVRPDLRMTLLDAQQKRVAFLREALSRLGLSAEAVHARAEDFGRLPERREAYDAALSRAVAGAAVLQELTLPLVRVGGVACAWKGPNVSQELTGARRAAFLLGGSVREPMDAPVPGRPEWRHTLLVTDKLRPTPKAYPRRAGLPERRPLA